MGNLEQINVPLPLIPELMKKYLVKPSQKAIDEGHKFESDTFVARDEDEARSFWCLKNGMISGHISFEFCDVEVLEETSGDKI